MITLFLLFFLYLVIFFLLIYEASPFVYIIFATVVSFLLGMLLVSLGLVFAGSVLIIVNSGAIAMVFLFVCVLSSRNIFVNRLVSIQVFFFYLLVFLIIINFLAFLFKQFFSETNFSNSLTPYVDKTPFSLIENMYSNDYSVISHLLLLENNIFFPNLLTVLGIFLIFSMCAAIIITKRF